MTITPYFFINDIIDDKEDESYKLVVDNYLTYIVKFVENLNKEIGAQFFFVVESEFNDFIDGVRSYQKTHAFLEDSWFKKASTVCCLINEHKIIEDRREANELRPVQMDYEDENLPIKMMLGYPVETLSINLACDLLHFWSFPSVLVEGSQHSFGDRFHPEAPNKDIKDIVVSYHFYFELISLLMRIEIGSFFRLSQPLLKRVNRGFANNIRNKLRSLNRSLTVSIGLLFELAFYISNNYSMYKARIVFDGSKDSGFLTFFDYFKEING